MKKRERVIGILGGLGPEATNKLCSEITALTPAKKDQEHLRVITFNNPKVPDRTKAILGQDKSPVRELQRTARALQNAGADFILLPCNTSHYYLRSIQRGVDIPIINMVEETVKHIVKNHPEVTSVGILATTGTMYTGLYEKALEKYGLSAVTPSDEEQEGLIMESIYGEKGLKAGFHDYPYLLLENAAQKLLERGAQVVIAGCTEIGIVLNKPPFIIIDSSRILAEVAVERASIRRTTTENFLFEVIVEPYLFIKRTAIEPFYYIKDKTLDLLEA
ncbi:amino acid racemase [archaeon]|jgi:aspartate racemase|nr:amino acid racemase [archaeon]MBT4417054.1 amino acid racemase [archaeon]